MTVDDDQDKESPLVGRWTYRSFMANPDISVDFAELEFGRGILLIDHLSPGLMVGRLEFGDENYSFRLNGEASLGDPPTFDFHGVNDAHGGQGEVYQYFACLMPLWPHDRRKRPTLVGTVIRAAPAGGDRPPSGLAANFIAIKQDVPPKDAPGSGSTGETSTPGTSTPGTSTPEQPGGGASGDPSTGTTSPTTPGTSAPDPSTTGPPTPGPSTPGPSTPEPSPTPTPDPPPTEPPPGPAHPTPGSTSHASDEYYTDPPHDRRPPSGGR
ncbi:MAG: hypothetical protein ABR540_03620 [Acidimicrobiales bacterium]